MPTIPLFLATLVLVAACATPQEPGLVIPLAAAPSNAGALGRATLLPQSAGTRIEVFFTAAGAQTTLPLHVYTFLYEGDCASLPEQPSFALNDVVLVRTPRGDFAGSRRGAFTLSHEVPLPLPELADGRYALALRAAPQDGGELLFCGAVRRA